MYLPAIRKNNQKNRLRYLAFSFSSYITVIRSFESRSSAQHLSRLIIASPSSLYSCFSFSFSLLLGSIALSSFGRAKGGSEKRAAGGLASCALSYYIYLFFSCSLLAFYCCCSSKLTLSLLTSALSLEVAALSELGTYIQLYCLAASSFRGLLLLSVLRCSGVLGDSLSAPLLCSSVLEMLRMQWEQSWLWKSAEAMMLYLVSTSRKVLLSSLSLFLNSSTRAWLWLMMLSSTIFYLYMLFSDFSYCSFDRSYPDSRPLMRFSYLATSCACSCNSLQSKEEVAFVYSCDSFSGLPPELGGSLRVRMNELCRGLRLLPSGEFAFFMCCNNQLFDKQTISYHNKLRTQSALAEKDANSSDGIIVCSIVSCCSASRSRTCPRCWCFYRQLAGQASPQSAC